MKRTLLARYFRKSKRSVSEFARAVEADRSQIYRCMRGERRPGLVLALRIERATAGAVPASSWAESAHP
jgi:DNA-binding phage protein